MKPAQRTRSNEFQCVSICRKCAPGGCGRRAALLLALLWVIPHCGEILAQQSTPRSSGQVSNRQMSPNQPDLTQTFPGSGNDSVFQQRRLRQLNDLQHKALISDADKLLKLVTQLNEQVDNTTPAALTPDQLRMVAEIEKLAHSVKDKMKNSVQGAPVFFDNQPPLISSPPRR